MISRILSKQNKALLSELVRTDFKLRYQGSVLGYLWALLKPLFLFAIMYVVFGVILKLGQGIPNYPVYLLVGVVLWTFFSETTRQGLSSIVSRGELIRKIKFPKYIIVVSSSISALINLCFNLLVVLFFIVLTGANIQAEALLLFPLLVIELYIFSLAIAFLLSAVNVRYRDVEHIWEILLQGGFYATPILYPITRVSTNHESLATAMLAFNPVAEVVQSARYLLVTTETVTLGTLTGNSLAYLIPLLLVIGTSLFAVVFFKKRSKTFAEDI